MSVFQRTICHKSGAVWFLNKTPIWFNEIKIIPREIWEGSLQTNLPFKKIFPLENITFHHKTIETQEEANLEEENFGTLLYTDASVTLDSNPPGQAATGSIWYTKKQNDNSLSKWEILKKETTDIGHGHSSFSAEGLAIQQALENCPEEIAKTTIGLFTDSHSNIRMLQNRIATTEEQKALKLSALH